MARGTLVSIAEHLLVIVEYLNLVDFRVESLCREQIAKAADRWANRDRRPHTAQNVRVARRRFLRYATRWLVFLGRFHVSCPTSNPYDSYIAEFAAFMLQERGLSAKTIALYCHNVRKFLSRLLDQDGSLERVSISQIDTALSQQVIEHGYARVTVQTCAGSLRAFFRYAEYRGWCTTGLASAIMAPRVFRHESLPSGPSWIQVQELLASTMGDNPTDIRDYALLLLLSVYGLRAGEVAQLRLDDIDWQNETILVRRSKRLGTHRYPLTRSVGDAIIRYLQEGRPQSSHREVFLTLNAPFRPITSCTLYPVVAARLRPLAVALRHHGPHALRHACATHLLNEGHTLKEVGDHLGHRNAETTRIYAKVNLAGLRDVANFDMGGLI